VQLVSVSREVTSRPRALETRHVRYPVLRQLLPLMRTMRALTDDLSGASRTGRLRETLQQYLQPHVLVVDEVGYLTYGPDAANVLFHVVNDRHLKKRPIVFTTNKSPLTAWGGVLHDHDLAEAIVDRTLERGRLLVLDGPSYRTRHLPLDSSNSNDDHTAKPARISGKHRPEFPEPTGVRPASPVTVVPRRSGAEVGGPRE
jgi:hypothetical protein